MRPKAPANRNSEAIDKINRQPSDETLPPRVERYRGDRRELMPLFSLADNSQIQIAAYLSLGEVLVARAGDAIVGHLQIVETDDSEVFELKSMAVTEARQGVGIRVAVGPSA